MAVNTSAGSTFSIGTTLAADTLLEYQSDVYKNVGEVANMGEFGRVYNEITFSSLDDRNVRKFKGQRNDGTMQLQLGRHATDLGQAAMFIALDDDHDYNFRVALNDAGTGTSAHPTRFYFRAKVMSYQTIVGGPDQIVQARANIGIQSGTIIEEPAV